MKRALIVAICVVAFAAVAFTQIAERLARPAKKQGIAVYYASEPVDLYETLGSVSQPGVVKNMRPTTLLPNLIDATRKKYPSADAIVVDDDMFNAIAIDFK